VLKGNPITIQGFDIPSDSPLFLTLLAIHVLAGLACVVAGAVAMLSKKQAGPHHKAGTVYYIFIWIVFITATIMAITRWKEDYHLFILGLISFCAAFIGRRARRHHWKKWSIIHIMGMGLSYILLITAFYVDNGKFLPIWKNFDPLVYWLLPSVIGIPILIRTLLRHPLSRIFFTRDQMINP